MASGTQGSYCDAYRPVQDVIPSTVFGWGLLACQKIKLSYLHVSWQRHPCYTVPCTLRRRDSSIVDWLFPRGLAYQPDIPPKVPARLLLRRHRPKSVRIPAAIVPTLAFESADSPFRFRRVPKYRHKACSEPTVLSSCVGSPRSTAHTAPKSGQSTPFIYRNNPHASCSS